MSFTVFVFDCIWTSFTYSCSFTNVYLKYFYFILQLGSDRGRLDRERRQLRVLHQAEDGRVLRDRKERKLSLPRSKLGTRARRETGLSRVRPLRLHGDRHLQRRSRDL